MTDPTPTPDPVELTDPPAAPAPEPTDPPTDPQPNAEAAKYRTKLRAAETELADANAHIAELQDAFLRNHLAGKLADPSLFGKLVDRDAWVGEGGRIDRAKLDTALAGLLEAHPHLAPQRARTGKQTPRQGAPLGGDVASKPLDAIDKAFPKSPNASWSNLLEKRPPADTHLPHGVGASPSALIRIRANSHSH